MKKIFLSLLIALLFTITVFAQKQGKGRMRIQPCGPVVTRIEPSLEDYDTYRDYVPIDDIYESFNNINGGFVEGKVFLTATMSYVGMDDHNTVTYIEPFEGTTPIAGGHAWTSTWFITATVNQWSGLIVQSPYGNWIQDEPFYEDEATVRIVNQGNYLYYYLNGVQVFSQYAPDINGHDWRALYIGDFDQPFIGILTKQGCIHPEDGMVLEDRPVDKIRMLDYQ